MKNCPSHIGLDSIGKIGGLTNENPGWGDFILYLWLYFEYP